MSNLYTCIIVEDEPLARQLLEQYISLHPSLSLVAICNNAIEAQQVLSKQSVHIMFLDINLPSLSGITFLKGMLQPPCVIFTTAYPEYAVEGFELNAVDYLLKPFSLERFLKAVNKAIERLDSKVSHSEIFVRSGKKVYRLNLKDILYIEGVDDYVKVVTMQGAYLVNDTLKNLLEQLPTGEFLRVHKSFIIARDRIVFIEGNFVRVGERDVPLGGAYKDVVMGLMGR